MTKVTKIWFSSVRVNQDHYLRRVTIGHWPSDQGKSTAANCQIWPHVAANTRIGIKFMCLSCHRSGHMNKNVREHMNNWKIFTQNENVLLCPCTRPTIYQHIILCHRTWHLPISLDPPPPSNVKFLFHLHTIFVLFLLLGLGIFFFVSFPSFFLLSSLSHTPRHLDLFWQVGLFTVLPSLRWILHEARTI